MAIRTSDGWEIKKTRKVKYDRPEEGSYVRLKSLKEICKLHGVGHWEDVYDPEIAKEMLYLFGMKVEVTSSTAYSSSFQAVDPKGGDRWYFRNDWIEANKFKIGLIPDELFEI
jgi:hypothetical protein